MLSPSVLSFLHLLSKVDIVRTKGAKRAQVLPSSNVNRDLVLMMNAFLQRAKEELNAEELASVLTLFDSVFVNVLKQSSICVIRIVLANSSIGNS